jgi:sugar/nucleoside kinase (ribokinase family)
MARLHWARLEAVDRSIEHMGAFDVVGVGIACVDLNATVTKIPRIDENVLILDQRLQLGGTVSTALAAMQRLGLKTKYMGMLGNDDYGRRVIEGMQAEGIDVGSVRMVDGESSPYSFVMVDSMSGKRSIAHFPGCEFMVPADCLDPDAVRSSSLLHVDIGTQAVFAACEIARDARVPISVEANVVYPGLDDLLAGGNIFISSREIMESLIGEKDPTAAGLKVRAEYDLDIVVVTCGAEGSLAVTSEGTVNAPGFNVQVVDTTGAGDVFHGAYLYGYVKHWPPERTLRFANAAAAIMCTTQSGWAGIPRLEDVEDFLRERDANGSPARDIG